MLPGTKRILQVLPYTIKAMKGFNNVPDIRYQCGQSRDKIRFLGQTFKIKISYVTFLFKTIGI